MIEYMKEALNLVGNQVRQQLRADGISVSAKDGFNLSLVEALLKNHRTFQQELARLDTLESDLALGQLEKAIARMNKHPANTSNAISPTWPASLNKNNSIGVIAMHAAFKELQAWQTHSLEQRLHQIFTYLGSVGKRDGYYDWCAAYVSWALEQVPAQKWGKHTPQTDARALGLYADFKSHPSTRNCVCENFEQGPPEPGDIVFWWRENEGSGKGHAGFVLESNDRHVTTLEGNSSLSIRLHNYAQESNPERAFYKDSKHGFVALLRLP